MHSEGIFFKFLQLLSTREWANMLSLCTCMFISIAVIRTMTNNFDRALCTLLCLVCCDQGSIAHVFPSVLSLCLMLRSIVFGTWKKTPPTGKSAMESSIPSQEQAKFTEPEFAKKWYLMSHLLLFERYIMVAALSFQVWGFIPLSLARLVHSSRI